MYSSEFPYGRMENVTVSRSPFPTQSVQYTSFDGGVTIRTRCRRPDRYAFWDSRDPDERTISRGAGLSYAAASFSSVGVATEHAHFNRILSFDPQQASVEVEAGITLGEVYDFLAPRGLYLSVQPGHPRITVGGCVAADVHGKNPSSNGTFISHVERIRLFHPSHGVLEVSRSNRPELFALTCGGYGLTGDILSVTLKAVRFPSPWVRLRMVELRNIHDLSETLRNATRKADFIYTWHDFTSRGKIFGRGYVVEGLFVTCKKRGFPPSVRPTSALDAATRGRWRVPFFNLITTSLFNKAYALFLGAACRERTVSLYDALFPVHDKEAYFKLFGRAGFLEYQVLVAPERFNDFMVQIRRQLGRRPVPLALGSAKLFGGQQDLLRFTGTGVCLALDFPRNPGGLAFASVLDDLVREFGARPNIIKDSRLPARVVEATYPECDLFRRRLAEFDPKRLYRSELSDRLRV